MIRPSWDEYFMEITKVVATRSTCLRRQVGATFVKDKNILATGYNGAPSGVEDCLEIGSCYRHEQNIPSGQQHERCRGSHAEMNGIAQSAKHGISIGDSVVYTTDSPCNICARLLINAGVKQIVSNSQYSDPMTEDLLKQAGIEHKLNHD
ncbi:dCMP deaminase family protein [Candidatus Woesearchaeota archaeon]|nr:dCMP deaminase family protein [Candidatus Woesearchaeota archaeon]